MPELVPWRNHGHGHASHHPVIALRAKPSALMNWPACAIAPEEDPDDERPDLVIAMRDLACQRDLNELSEPDYDTERRKLMRCHRRGPR
jgi:hypothetical protein